jgi:cell division septation protein DedD
MTENKEHTTKTNLTHRLLGAGLLLFAVILIVPFFLDGNGLKYVKSRQKFSDIPPMPIIPEHNNDTTDNIDEIKINIQQDLDESKNQQQQQIKIIKKKYGDDFVTLKSYALQVGSFTDEFSAQRFIEDLKKNKFRVFLLKTKKDDKDYYQVRIGPFKTHKDAAVSQKKYKQKYQSSSIIIDFDSE